MRDELIVKIIADTKKELQKVEANQGTLELVTRLTEPLQGITGV